MSRFDPSLIGRDGRIYWVTVPKPPKCIIRVNHFLLWSRGTSNQADVWMGWLPESVAQYVMTLLGICRSLAHRYIYLTIDTAPIQPGVSQRAGGWHVDGFQGDEIETKQIPDTHFIVANKLPTEFAAQDFDMRGFDPSRHNLSRWISPQVHDGSIASPPDGHGAIFNAYAVHRGANSPFLVTDRVFYRLSFTDTPVTSVKMTINPEAEYDYPIHTTSGEIPSHLI